MQNSSSHTQNRNFFLKSFALALVLICSIPVLMTIIFSGNSVFEMWLGVFHDWSGGFALSVIRLIPGVNSLLTYPNTLGVYYPAAIFLANIAFIGVCSTIVYLVSIRKSLVRWQAILLAIVWGVFIVEAIGACPAILFGIAFHPPPT
jgi:hypothetical protein